jgi:hypothetical protein
MVDADASDADDAVARDAAMDDTDASDAAMATIFSTNKLDAEVVDDDDESAGWRCLSVSLLLAAVAMASTPLERSDMLDMLE